jgi:hypothetical protein
MQTQSPALSINSAQLSPRAAEYFQNTFQARYDALIARIPQTPFSVILWGPGPGTLILYNKRVQIRDELRTQGQAAFLAEELEQGQGAILLPRVQKLMQASAADLVVVVVATTADIANAQDFTADAAVNAKLLVFAPDVETNAQYRAAMSQLASHYDSVRAFQFPDDVASCHLKALVLDKLGELQLAKWRATAQTTLQG